MVSIFAPLFPKVDLDPPFLKVEKDLRINYHVNDVQYRICMFVYG